MLKSILRVFHTWDGTTDPLPDRASHNEYQLTTRLGIFWLTRIEDYLIGVSAYVRRSSILTPNVNIYQKALRRLAPPSSVVPFLDSAWVSKVKSNVNFSCGAAARNSAIVPDDAIRSP
jgi:hypothetical protein